MLENRVRLVEGSLKKKKKLAVLFRVMTEHVQVDMTSVTQDSATVLSIL